MNEFFIVLNLGGCVVGQHASEAVVVNPGGGVTFAGKYVPVGDAIIPGLCEHPECVQIL